MKYWFVNAVCENGDWGITSYLRSLESFLVFPCFALSGEVFQTEVQDWLPVGRAKLAMCGNDIKHVDREFS